MISLARKSAYTNISITALDLFVLGSIWISMIMLVNPVGNFPLNDDWSYGRAVQHLIEEGRLELTGFTSMPLLAQVFWGALFCIPFGFSFTALRVSTLILGLLGILATYWVFKEVKLDRSIALLGTMILAVNPLYFQLSLTFMTDVPFFAFSMFAFLFFLRTLRTESVWDVVTGYVFSLIAILIRQLAIVIPLSFLFAYLVKNRIGRKTVVNALLPNGAFICFLFAFPIFLRQTIGLPALYGRSFEPISEAAPMGWFQIPFVFADRILVEILYLGLFLLPFLIMLEIMRDKNTSPRTFSLFADTLLFGVISTCLIWQGRMMPLAGNVLFDLGIGPILLRDTYLLGLPHWPIAHTAFWVIVTTASIFGGVLLFRHLSRVGIKIFRWPAAVSKDERNRLLFLFAAAISYSILIGIAGFLDRYLIWLLPLILGVILIPISSVNLSSSFWALSVAVMLIFIYGLFAVGGTHDFLAFNRARWQALTDLMEKEHISYKNIDGGFEFNGWFAYNAEFHPNPSKSWWWVEDDNYVISAGPLSGYAEWRRYPFKRWIAFGQGYVFVLRRLEREPRESFVK